MTVVFFVSMLFGFETSFNSGKYYVGVDGRSSGELYLTVNNELRYRIVTMQTPKILHGS